jgi:hypothetical protein
MNERIRELANQAYGITDAKPFHPSALIALEQFAQLIALECAYMVNDYQRTTEYTDFAKMLCDKFDIEFQEEDFWSEE